MTCLCNFGSASDPATTGGGSVSGLVRNESPFSGQTRAQLARTYPARQDKTSLLLFLNLVFVAVWFGSVRFGSSFFSFRRFCEGHPCRRLGAVATRRGGVDGGERRGCPEPAGSRRGDRLLHPGVRLAGQALEDRGDVAVTSAVGP